MRLINCFKQILSNPKKNNVSKPLRLLGNLKLMQWIIVQYLGSHVLVLFVCVFL